MAAYKDILLAETDDGSPVIVVAPSYRFQIGSLVVYDDGKLATVQKRAWIGEAETNQDILDILTSITEVYEAEACLTRSWAGDAHDVKRSP